MTGLQIDKRINNNIYKILQSAWKKSLKCMMRLPYARIILRKDQSDTAGNPVKALWSLLFFNETSFLAGKASLLYKIQNGIIILCFPTLI